ncbi:unnamed protein product [Didymodactylos carnosus]|uniref:peptidylprolyl isomerase n=1 Tax=Didymodactylos carnosus TaxID=1234261 RepID=A0A813TDA6_9BILA|nr:unnamed protein product [Didymodactylos carnosus]CAF0884478.1 unnamed protein product [Didymodactylos carnosus]CAF3593223.1 unnamed protein product [Didymodactylos carnosus]CAF3667632.1 unnamed protein product [Didymodactylos carnosus]
MFRNPPYNIPSDFPQNLADLSLGTNQSDFVQFQGLPVFDGYSNNPSIDGTNLNSMKWPSPEDVQQTYQQGYTVVRQFNNSVIDDYYKKFLRPITDYVAIPTNGQPTYVYQNLGTNGQTVGAQQTTDQSNGIQKPVEPPIQAQEQSDETEEKKHKKKHKKKSSKPNGESKTDETDNNTPSIADQQQKQGGTEHGQKSETPPTETVVDSKHSYHSSSKKKSSSSKSHKKSSSDSHSKHTSSTANPDQIQNGQSQQVGYEQQQRLSAQQGRYEPPTDSQQQIKRTQPPVVGIGRSPAVNYGPAHVSAPMKHESNPVVYFEIEIDDDPRGRLVMEVFRHALPRTTQNFLALATNQQGYGYRLSYFHRIIPGFMAQAGDFERSDGTGGYSIYGEKFEDEGFMFRHDRPGLLSMANSGPHTNGSQFFITFVPCPHLDNKHVVFGQLIQGFHLLKDLEMSGSDGGEVTREVKIADSGQLQ